MPAMDMERKNRIAQWAFDTRPILGRFHLWLEDVEVETLHHGRVDKSNTSISFVEGNMERMFIMSAAVTALGTRLFGRYGEGKNLEKKELNQVKKDADAISAYALSESLWYLSRSLPENHAIMVCVGEGLMPKAGETPEMGSNPMLGFGRIYARPQIAKFLEVRIQDLINRDGYSWDHFRHEVSSAGITIWGAAIDTLENTSRFAKGGSDGPLTVIHLFDQPLCLTKPYEGYIGNLFLPADITRTAAKMSVLINYLTPRAIVLQVINATYPDIAPENIHVWTLAGKSREGRIGKLWQEWSELGVHLVEDGWQLPGGGRAFCESGTYAPTYKVGAWRDEHDTLHLFLVDGYAASAEAIQAASLCPLLDLEASLAVFTSKFKLSYEREAHIMHLDPESHSFREDLSRIFAEDLNDEKVSIYQEDIRQAASAGIPLEKLTVSIDDFLPEKKWRVIAISGFMLPDPYSGSPGMSRVNNDIYQVTVRLSTREGEKKVKLTLRLEESLEESRLVFNPLLNRFLKGENFRERAVKISDSGRIRNELQTLCSEALEHFGSDGVRVHFGRISEDVIFPQDQKRLREILSWYKKNHPIWFKWLELGD